MEPKQRNINKEKIYGQNYDAGRIKISGGY